MSSEVVQLTRRGFGGTMRRDAWWVQPLVVFIVLAAFLVYATWAAFQNKYYAFGNYLSPLSRRKISAAGDSEHSSVFPLRGAGFPGDSVDRRLQGDVVL